MGRGSISLRCQLPNSYKTVVLHEALYIPGLTTNLVSLGALQREGAMYRRAEGGMMVMLDDEDLFKASLGRSNNLYPID